MAENQNDNLDELLNDIALEPDNQIEDNNTVPVDNEDNASEPNDDELAIEQDELVEVEQDNTSEVESNDEPTNGATENEEGDIELDELSEEKEYAVQKKQTKLQKILIGIVIALILIIVAGLIAYFLGVFDPEEEPKKEMAKKEETMKPKKPSYNFKDKDINVDRLNEKLNMLTKYEIIEDAKKEEAKALEKERLHQEAQQKLEEERLAKIKRVQELENKRLEEELAAKKREEELMNQTAQKIAEQQQKEEEPQQEVITVVKENNDITVTMEEPKSDMPEITVEMEQPQQEQKAMPEVAVVEMEEPMREEPQMQQPVMQEPIQEDMPEVVEEEEKTLENNFIKFIVITTNKREIYKKDLEKITSIDSNIKLCRDDSNNIEVFVGPYDEAQRDIKLAVFNYAMKNEMIEALDFTEEEFNKRCNY